MTDPDPLSLDLTAAFRRLERRLDRLEHLIGLYREIDGLTSLPPLRGYAIFADTGRVLIDLCREHLPAHVLECGSGASTVLLAHLLRDPSSSVQHVTSLEHNPFYRDETLRSLRAANLADLPGLDLRLAPLVDREFPPPEPASPESAPAESAPAEPIPWYDVDPSTILPPIDLLLVDGPPGHVHPRSRYPAVPVLLPVMRPGCLIVVDDYRRDSERSAVAAWRDELPIEVLDVDPTVEKGIAVLRYTPT